MSSVFRVAVSNVRIPRSQSMTLSFPEEMMYSADMRSSSMVVIIPRFSSTGFLACPTFFKRAKFCTFRAPICMMSVYSSTSSTSVVSRTSVTTGRPVASPAFFRSFRPASSIPWKLYGDVLGLNAPPLSMSPPPFLTIRALSISCSSLSIEQGPAITTNSGPPISTSPIRMTVFPSLDSLLASLYGLRIGITFSTPEKDSGIFNCALARSSPTTPMIVRSAPVEGWVL